MHRSTLILTLPLLLLACGAPDPAASASAAAAASATLTTLEDDSLRVSPPAVFFDSTCTNDEATQDVTLTNISGNTVRVSALRMTGSAYSLGDRPSVPFALRPGQRRTLTVRFSPSSSRTSPYEGNLRIVSNSGNTDVALAGLSLPGTLNITPRQHDFGNVGAGRDRSVQLTMRTRGCGVSLGDHDFSGRLSYALSLDRMPRSVETGETERINVELRCSGEDDFLNAELRLFDRDGVSVGNVLFNGYCRADD